jgi:predicted nucleic acid-binding protein
VKVVFDSNIYVSTLATPGGVADRAIRAATEAALEIFISRPILEEVLRVMARKFARAPEELARTALPAIARCFRWVRGRESKSSRFGNSSIGSAKRATSINHGRLIG